VSIGGLFSVPEKYRNSILIIILVVASIWVVLPNNPGIHIGGFNRDIKTHLGLDLVGGVQVLLEADLSEAQTVTSEAINTARQIVENRVNGLGVSEAVVTRIGDRRISVELPGLEDPEEAIQTLRGTGLLEFVDLSSISVAEAQSLVGLSLQTDFSTNEPPTPSDSDLPTTVLNLQDRIWPTILTGADLKSARVGTDEFGQYLVEIEFNVSGVDIFDEFTGTHIGDVLAITLDKTVISAPTIQNRIDDGKAVITGRFAYDEANQLAVQLRYGALPVPLKVVETRTVGPSLGSDSLQKSLVAGSIGAVIILSFMALYYRLPGVVANVAIIIYALITFALYRTIPVTLTLPGIAGFLLSTGSALDANILIFERMKEELREGRTLLQAIDLGWRRAWSSIRDSNLATILTSIVLWIFAGQSGATIVIGFAFTLLVGVLVSLFTALFVTRTLLNLVFGIWKPENLSRWFGI
jgi:preprotein translocase subunit SecD